MKRSLILLVALGLPLGTAIAADEVQQTRQQVYGSQLMTPQERMEYRSKMRSMKTREEREAFRMEHHKQMQERARERGVQLPDMPPQGMRRGMGPGGGMGGGMGPGGGMGGGMGPGGGMGGGMGGGR